MWGEIALELLGQAPPPPRGGPKARTERSAAPRKGDARRFSAFPRQLDCDFLGPGEECPLAHERAAVATRQHLPTDFPQPPPSFRLCCSRSAARGPRGGLGRCLRSGLCNPPGSSRIEPRPRSERTPQGCHAQLEPGDIRKKISAIADYRVRQRPRAQAYSTTCRSGIAAARRHIGLDLMNDLGQLVTAVRAYIFSITLHMQFDYYATTTRPTRKTFPRPVPRHLSWRWRWGSTPQWAAGGRLPLLARRKVRGSRNASNSAPKVPQSGVPATH